MLYIVATPIGNLEDITLRALRCLKEVDYILAEDARKTGMLLKHFGIKKHPESFYEHNEVKKMPAVLEALRTGRAVALLSNAGTPTISDPGYKLVRECRKEGLPITVLPGPSSIVSALAMTSIPHEKFAFFGYIPRKKNQRLRFFEKIKAMEGALVFFESPFRLIESLRVMNGTLGDRRIGIFREISKKFEEALELTIQKAMRHFENYRPRGEFTIIVEGYSATE